MVFNVLTHNRDDHTKNFAFMLTNKSWQLTPAYDLTFCGGPGGEHTMTIAGAGKNPVQEDMLKVAASVNINKNDAKRIIDEVAEAVGHWSEHANEAGVSKESRVEIKRVISK